MLASALVFAGASCAEGATPDNPLDTTSSTTSSTSSGAVGFGFHRDVTIEGAVPAGYAVAIQIDHAGLVAASKALADGEDVRVFFVTAEGSSEIDRVLDPLSDWNQADTTLWFKTGEGEGTYQLVYGSANDSGALQDPTQVWLYYSSDPGGWSVADIGNGMNGNYEVKGGVITLTGTSGDFGGSSDNLVFLIRELQPWIDGTTAKSDYVVDAQIKDASGSLGAAAKMGGLMVRQTNLEDARMAASTIRQMPRARFASKREQDMAMVVNTELPAGEMFPQLMRLRIHAGTANTSYSDDGKNYIQLGDVAVLNLTVPFVVGVPLANISGGQGKVEVDWFRVRPLVVPEPVVTLGEEIGN